MSIEGRFVRASNATLLGTTDSGDAVVYKPVAGERPLWDFAAESLAVREVLTYELDRLLEFGVVPETALGDGLYGPGSVQRYVSDIDETFDAYTLTRRTDAMLWPIAVLDVVTNNADRKLGHILRRRSGELVAIDHGLTFHPDDKLRTVLWDFAGQEVPAGLTAALARACDELEQTLGPRVASLLGRRELVALQRRIEGLVAHPVHPQPPVDRPALPWPPY